MQPTRYHPMLTQLLQAHPAGSSELSGELLSKISAYFEQAEQDNKRLETMVIHRTDQLIASTSQAYSFLDSIHKGFMMCDTSGEVVLTNQSLRELFAEQLSSESFPLATQSYDMSLVASMFAPELNVRQLIADCLKTSQPQTCNAVVFGKRYLQLYIAPLQNTSGVSGATQLGVVMLVEDITEEKTLERSKDEFLSIASHELRTPLTAIRGNASLIKKYYSDSIVNQDMAEMIEDIHTSSIRLIGIVNDFLDVAAIEQGKILMTPGPTSLADIITDVVHEFEHVCADKGIILKQAAGVTDTPLVFADTQRIKQVIINLVGNAIKCTLKGSITIATTATERYVYTSVTDTGRGMDVENQKLLFHKFQQAGSSILTRDTSKGTGLGLYISRQIIELSGGMIGLAHSQPGVGSCFSFSLPRA